MQVSRKLLNDHAVDTRILNSVNTCFASISEAKQDVTVGAYLVLLSLRPELDCAGTTFSDYSGILSQPVMSFSYRDVQLMLVELNFDDLLERVAL